MSLLQSFNGDFATKEALLEYIHAHINTTALERMYRKEDVSHIADAKELIDSAFNQLEEDFGIKVKQNAVTNEAK